MTLTLVAPRPANKPPRRASLGRFLHLLARRYMDYPKLVIKASRRKKGKGRRVDVDEQDSLDKTGWALHWATLGQNKLHDPKGIYHKNTRIDSLHDRELARMRGPRNQIPQKLSAVLRLCEEHHVEAEIETKSETDQSYWVRLAERPYVKRMLARDEVVVKTLAGIPGAVHRLTGPHAAGFPTVLSFTGFSRKDKPISKAQAWPVTDMVRGTPRWAA